MSNISNCPAMWNRQKTKTRFLLTKDTYCKKLLCTSLEKRKFEIEKLLNKKINLISFLAKLISKNKRVLSQIRGLALLAFNNSEQSSVVKKSQAFYLTVNKGSSDQTRSNLCSLLVTVNKSLTLFDLKGNK